MQPFSSKGMALIVCITIALSDAAHCALLLQKSPPPYEKALGLLKEGKQSQAEDELASAVKSDPQNQRLVFFMGVCARSRWAKGDALAIFNYAIELNPETPEAKCAALMVAIDSQTEYETSFKALEELQKSQPADPLILWMAAVACREIGRRDGPRVYSEQGAVYYSKLLTILDPGPVLLHQTCANILSEDLGRHEEALTHREIAVRMEPAAWSYQGMANTLTYLGRFAEADSNYTQSVKMAPYDPVYISSWAWSLCQRGEYEKALRKYYEAIACDPNRPESWRKLEWCALKLGQNDVAAAAKLKADQLEKK